MKFEKNRKTAQYCPCGKSNKNGKFAPYFGHIKYGFCHSCNSTFNPNNRSIIGQIHQQQSERKPSFIKQAVMIKSLSKLGNNTFFQFLSSYFEENEALKVFNRYKIGSSKRWNGSTVFWQIDHKAKVRSGKIMLYNSKNGKRVKSCTDWAHAVLLRNGSINDFNLEQCLFGLHLTTDKRKEDVIAIVESEKTACIMSIIYPRYIWLACGGLGSLHHKKLKTLKESSIILFPDLGPTPSKDDEYSQCPQICTEPCRIECLKSKKSPFLLWSQKAILLEKQGYKIKVSNLLEKVANTKQKEQKLDIADFFIKKR